MRILPGVTVCGMAKEYAHPVSPRYGFDWSIPVRGVLRVSVLLGMNEYRTEIAVRVP